MSEDFYIYWYSNEEFNGEAIFLAEERQQEYQENNDYLIPLS
jgi:hypothetical protein